MMPVVLPAPTFSGNCKGELAPLDRYTNFGLNFSCTSALTCAYASWLWVPPTSTSGCAAATLAITGDRSWVSAGYTCLNTVLMPAASNLARMLSAIRAENGSSSSAYAAVLGRSAAGSDSTQLANTSPDWTDAAAWTTNRFGSLSPNTHAPPPAAS